MVKIMKPELDQMAKDIIADGKCCMCNCPLPKNNITQVACNDCTEYAFEVTGIPKKGRQIMNKSEREQFNSLVAQLELADYVLSCVESNCHRYDEVSDRAIDIQIMISELREIMTKMTRVKKS